MATGTARIFAQLNAAGHAIQALIFQADPQPQPEPESESESESESEPEIEPKMAVQSQPKTPPKATVRNRIAKRVAVKQATNNGARVGKAIATKSAVKQAPPTQRTTRQTAAKKAAVQATPKPATRATATKLATKQATIRKSKDVPFTVYNLQDKKPQKLPSPPIKIYQSKLDLGEWTPPTRDMIGSKVRKAHRRKKPAAKKPRTAVAALRALAAEEWTCMQCTNYGNHVDCTSKCYSQFREQFIAGRIDIRGPGPHGYGAFTKRGVNITKHQYVDEYIGDLRPLNSEAARGSLYCFTIPGRCIVDAERAGNWTRFINSSCRPNLASEPGFVGGRHVIIFYALKDIGPEEELTFNYGKNYFKNAKISCTCDAQEEPHIPSQR